MEAKDLITKEIFGKIWEMGYDAKCCEKIGKDRTIKEDFKEFHSSGGYLDALLDAAGEQEEVAKCDVLKCNESVCNQGSCWRNTGYWCVCREHSQMHRDGKAQPKMKKKATERENSRDENGYLPLSETVGSNGWRIRHG